MKDIKIILLNEKNIDKTKFIELINFSIVESDYMVMGEISTSSDVDKILTNKNIFNFLILDKNKYIGYCQVIRRVDSYEFKSNAKVNAISILPSERNKGYASALLSHVLSWTKEEKIKLVYLDVINMNVNAKKLYEKFNFLKTGNLKDAYKKELIYFDLETYSLSL